MATRDDIKYFRKGILHDHTCIVRERDVPVFVWLVLEGESNSVIAGVSKALISGPQFRTDYDNSAFMDRSLAEKLNPAYISRKISKLFKKKEKSGYLDISPEQVYLSRFKGILNEKYIEFDMSESDKVDSFLKNRIIPVLENIPPEYTAGGDATKFYLIRGDNEITIKDRLFSSGCLTEDGKISIDVTAFVSNLDREIALNEVIRREWSDYAKIIQKANMGVIDQNGGFYG